MRGLGSSLLLKAELRISRPLVVPKTKAALKINIISVSIPVRVSNTLKRKARTVRNADQANIISLINPAKWVALRGFVMYLVLSAVIE